MKRLLIPALILLGLWPVSLPAREERLVDVVDVASRAIVNIRTEEAVKGGSENRNHGLFKRFFSAEPEEEVDAVENIGSGVVLDPKGIIVTNEHLISRAMTIRVKFINRQEYEAHVIAADPELDVALLQVEHKNDSDFPFLKVVKKTVMVGERAIVIGNPYGLSGTVTTGVVSAFRRNVKINDRVYSTLIQTDAAINPGNSGGALLDGDGTLLGIVTAVYEEGKGIGFAIPIDDVMTMLSEFLEHAGRRPIFGIFIDRGKEDDRQYLSVAGVIPGSPAEESGMKVGDRIIELDHKKIREGMKFQNVLRKAGLSGKTEVEVVRGHETFTIDLQEGKPYVPAPLDERLCGVRVSDIAGYVRLKFKLRQTKGVVVTKVFKGGLGERYGLRPGDVIIRINNGEVADKRRFEALMVEGLRKNYILYQVKRNDNLFFLPIKLDTLL
jgi:serine protease Do